jgi:hypothetical protein
MQCNDLVTRGRCGRRQEASHPLTPPSLDRVIDKLYLADAVGRPFREVAPSMSPNLLLGAGNEEAILVGYGERLRCWQGARRATRPGAWCAWGPRPDSIWALL